MPHTLPRSLYSFQTGPREITTHDAFDRERLGFLHDHRAAANCPAYGFS